jgi:hypothetical protein
MNTIDYELRNMKKPFLGSIPTTSVYAEGSGYEMTSQNVYSNADGEEIEKDLEKSKIDLKGKKAIVIGGSIVLGLAVVYFLMPKK